MISASPLTHLPHRKASTKLLQRKVISHWSKLQCLLIAELITASADGSQRTTIRMHISRRPDDSLSIRFSSLAKCHYIEDRNARALATSSSRRYFTLWYSYFTMLPPAIITMTRNADDAGHFSNRIVSAMYSIVMLLSAASIGRGVIYHAGIITIGGTILHLSWPVASPP